MMKMEEKPKLQEPLKFGIEKILYGSSNPGEKMMIFFQKEAASCNIGHDRFLQVSRIHPFGFSCII